MGLGKFELLDIVEKVKTSEAGQVFFSHKKKKINISNALKEVMGHQSVPYPWYVIWHALWNNCFLKADKDADIDWPSRSNEAYSTKPATELSDSICITLQD